MRNNLLNSAPINVCPRGPHSPGPDCPLWGARERIALQRAIEVDGAARAGLSALVWADIRRGFRRPESPPTRPVPSIQALPESIAESIPKTKKEVSHHA